MKKPNEPMDRIPMPAALLACRLLSSLGCQKQVGIGHRGRSATKMILRSLLLLIALSTPVSARDYSRMSVEEMVGAVLIDHARSVVELQRFTHFSKDTPVLDDLIVKLKPSYERLPYKERCEFAFYVISYAQLDAGFSLMFKDLIKADAPQIRGDLMRIPDSVLQDRFSMSESAIRDFRSYVTNGLNGIDFKWKY
ncbi:MAG: hypothetical protein WC657_09700 [Candidatus Paceibacterota bacterium]|jgi:hypothetical protein